MYFPKLQYRSLYKVRLEYNIMSIIYIQAHNASWHWVNNYQAGSSPPTQKNPNESFDSFEP